MRPPAEREPLAVMTLSVAGMSHYTAHLWQPLARYFTPCCLTPAGFGVDDLFATIVAEVHPLFDVQDEESPEAVLCFLEERGIQILNLQVSTWVVRNLAAHQRLCEALRRRDIRLLFHLHNVLPHNPSDIDELSRLRDFYALAD